VKTTMMAALALLAFGSAQAADKMAQTAKVVSQDGKVLVTMTVENDSGKTIYVPKAVFKDKELFGRVFDLRSPGTRAEIEYTGPMVKRGPYTKDDYVAVKSGGKLSNTLDISRSYAFMKGTHRYELHYAGSMLPGLDKVDDATPVTVAPVTFTHTVK
jgi:hypothetical protein